MTAYVQYQTFRTIPFQTPSEKDAGTMTYWCYETAVGRKEGRLCKVVVESKSRTTTPFTAPLPELEALTKLAAIEAEARKTFAPAHDADPAILKSFGTEYPKMIPYLQHPVMIAETRHALLKKQPGAGKFKLKP